MSFLYFDERKFEYKTYNINFLYNYKYRPINYIYDKAFQD